MTEDLNKRLKNVAVIGAGGKMGRGISLVLLKTIIAPATFTSMKDARLILIDNSLESLSTLRVYLKTQLLKFAERNINQIREIYREDLKLIDNSEIIDRYIEDGMSIIQTSTDVGCCQNSLMIFEAIFESLDLKTSIYRRLKNIVPKECYFFSNTSSIPISEIDNQAELDHRIIGFHFYNPPAIQKLVEVISTAKTPKNLLSLSDVLIGSFGKIKVPSNDIAGFIGNGHFIREGLSIIKHLNDLPYQQDQGIYHLNQIVANVMLRPMGMFQLIDYVGLDVFSMICKTMQIYIDENFSHSLIEELINNGIKGGQFGNGSQKDGFFKYDKGKIAGVINLKKKSYTPIEELKEFDIEDELCGGTSWKELSRSRDTSVKLTEHFNNLQNNNSAAAKTAKSLLKQYIQIGQDLIKGRVTDDIVNVDSVLKNGFYHLYGPGADFIQSFQEVK